ncbi:hypothetical protein QAD02_007291 [Eretmocerus hayati]|uniref:Uncharacterized protein n=1 Tax=Eretmocerus hayati TaxID=131215 RepID=A0ACC2N5M4_9HYME|nr:hypothetical protein QAD02_007291 [Eretmocerus hayati]
MRIESHLAAIPDDELIVCGFRSAKSFETKNAYRIHINRYHGEITLEHALAPTFPENTDSDPLLSEHAENPQYPLAFPPRDLQLDHQFVEVTNNLFDDGSNLNRVIDDSAQIPVDVGLPQTNLIHNYSSLYLRMETQHNATEPLIQDVVNTTSSSLVQCEKLFNSRLAQSDLSQRDKETVENILRESFGKIIDCHDPKKGDLRSTFTRHKLYRSNPRYVKPLKLKLRDKNGRETHCHYTYVPPLETLRLMLEDDEIRELIDSDNRNPDDDGIFDICDGNVVKKNRLFIIYRNGLEIAIFQDVFEVCNPLASAKTKFKIIGVYMMIANLPPHLRSKTNNIKLVLLCFDKYINEFGWDEILDRFLSDMIILETEGVSYSVSGTVQTRRGTIIVGVGDSLVSHCLGGYAKNFSTVQFFSRYCESCMCNYIVYNGESGTTGVTTRIITNISKTRNR